MPLIMVGIGETCTIQRIGGSELQLIRIWLDILWFNMFVILRL
mgnify:CR=1 FL=1